MTFQHHPPHLYLNDTFYFVTSKSYKNQNIFTNIKTRLLDRRQEFLKAILCLFGQNQYKLFGWTINPNHYHLLFQTNKGASLPKIFQELHGGFSYRWNQEEGKQGRKIWQNYFDTCIRNESAFYRHLNYIHHNPVKHGLVANMEDYLWSSYGHYFKKYGGDWLADCFEQYPIADFTPLGEDYKMKP